ncbi:cupredoxin domain-containing protein [Ferrimicrobium acidiphilum]|jgi:plastocyanin|uniref:cupredoxin domain-containing protein n=1 Tax=Ferrimicrobium acidiphilum TaxID=121039 RepID=UPI0006985161|nr:cupredoxin domain-containing protein [Ferrimicrobium acidiphilum]MCL5054023.1 cupredoxin domain-containing protein [Gammaproteobacteria bacterium]
MRQLRVIIFTGVMLVLGGLVLAACGSNASSVGASNLHPGPSSSGRSATIVISNFQFIPDQVVVHQGEEIIVHNEDSVGHTLTANNGSFGTGVISPGHTVHFIIHDKPGTYPFLCRIHQFMTGTIVVVK